MSERYINTQSKFKGVCKSIKNHITDFSLVWLLLLIIFIGVVVRGAWSYWLSYLGLILIIIILVISEKPLNIVYGLIGTSGSIQIFFLSFIIISLAFSGIYYCGFFNHAYVSYDVNQPHVHFVQPKHRAIVPVDTIAAIAQTIDSTSVEKDSVCSLSILPQEDCLIQTPVVCYSFEDLDDVYNNGHKSETIVSFIEKADTTYVFNLDGERVSYYISTQELKYQRIFWHQVLRNTVMTSLISEPSDLFAAAAVYNDGRYESPDCEDAKYNIAQAELFQWILTLQILISWILLGVFISILYNKFRYES